MVVAVPPVFVVGILGVVLAATFLLDEVKIWFYQNTGILGKSSQTPKA